jgi:hypothetical protein
MMIFALFLIFFIFILPGLCHKLFGRLAGKNLESHGHLRGRPLSGLGNEGVADSSLDHLLVHQHFMGVD